jgi:Fe-S-cluster containining protein
MISQKPLEEIGFENIEDHTEEFQLKLPAGIHYTCHHSGACCSTFPNIEVDATTIASWEKADLQQVRGNGCTVNSVEDALVQSKDNNSKSLRMRSDCSCVFLTSEKKCAIHSGLGPQLKPQACRDFPFRFRSTPGGIYVGLSFVCPSVRANRGTALNDQRAQLTSMFTTTSAKAEISGPVLLNDHIELNWSQYLMIESALNDILDRSDLPLETRLIAFNVLTGFLDAFYTQLRGAANIIGNVGQFSDAELMEFLLTIKQQNYSEIFRIATKPRRSQAVQRMFLGMITSFGNTLFAKRGRALAVAAIGRQYLRHAIGVGSIRLKPFTGRVSYRHLQAVKLPTNGPGGELVLRYLRHCIFRKDLVYESSLANGINLLLLNSALLRWYAAAQAAQGHGSSPDEQDFSEAIAQVEKLYGFHSKFYAFFSQHGAMNEVIESFTIRRNYPFIILGTI